jgi:hypothetical protein
VLPFAKLRAVGNFYVKSFYTFLYCNYYKQAMELYIRVPYQALAIAADFLLLMLQRLALAADFCDETHCI